MGLSRRRNQKNGRKSRKNEFLPFFKTVYASRQSGGGTTIWTTAGSYSVTSITGQTTSSTCNVGSAAYGVDGTNTTSVLYAPNDIDIDSAGNIYIMQTSGDIRMRKMDPAGNVVSLIKGGGTSNGGIITGAYPADKGSAQIYQNGYLCVDKATDIIYFSDNSYHLIRLVTSNSATATALSGKSLPTGGPNPFPTGGVSTLIGTVGNQTKDGNQDNAYFQHPQACAYDSLTKRMYIGDDNAIRMIDNGYGRDPRVGPNSNDRMYVSSLAKVKIAGITVDVSGNIFYTVDSKHTIWKLVPPPYGNVLGTNINDYNTSGTKTTLLRPPAANTHFLFAGSDTSSGYTDAAKGTDALFNKPLGLSCDSDNNVYVADSLNNVIRMITPQGAVFTVAGVQGQSLDLTNVAKYGDGVNTMAQFSNPISVVVDATKSIFVLDRGTSMTACASFSRIRKIVRIPPPSAPTSFSLVYTDSISATFTWADALTGQEPDYPAGFYFLVQTAANPTDTRVDIQPIPTGSTSLSVPNQLLKNNLISPSYQQGFYLKNIISVPLTQNTTYTSVKLVAFNNSGNAVSAPITTPIVIKPSLTMYTILKCGKVASPGYVNSGALFSQFNNLKGVAMDQAGNVYVADSSNHGVQVINNIGQSSPFFGIVPPPGGAPSSGSTLTALNSPSDITFSYSGAFPLYIADTGNNRILSVNATGVATLVAITSATPATLTLQSPTSIAIDPAGNFYITSSASHCIYKVTSAGALSLFGGIVGTAGGIDGAGSVDTFNAPNGIVYDDYGKCLYVADTGNHLIRKILFDAANTVTTLAGSRGIAGMTNGLGSVARFNTPTDLVTDADGNVYVTDQSNHCIRKINIAGLVSTYSGMAGTSGFLDGSSTPTAYNTITGTVKYNRPFGICRNSSGTFMITDSANTCVRCISPNPAPTKPTSVRLSDFTKDSATITWSGDTGGTFYAYSISPMSQSIVIPTSTSSPATFTGLLDSTQYSLSLIVGNTAGAVFPEPVKCITKINPDNFVLTVPSTKSMGGIGSVKSVVTANLSWTGVPAANVMQYSINPAQTDAKTTGTFPANQKSPYTISNLDTAKSYTITLTATINNVPGTTILAAKYIRFTVTSALGGTSNDYAVASFGLLNGGTTVAWPANTLVYPVTVGTTTKLAVANPADNGPGNLLNASNTIGKYLGWYPRGTGSTNPAAVIFELGVATEFTAYKFGVADLLSRTPNRWKLEYSIDGVTFNMLDDRTDSAQMLPATTASYTDIYPVNFSKNDTVTSNPATFTTQTPVTTNVTTIAGVSGGVVDTNTTATATPSKNLLTIPIKNQRGITIDKNGALFISSGTCIVKITPPLSTAKNYLFDTTIPNPTPILVTPNPITDTNGSEIMLYAGNPTTGATPGNNSGNNIRFYNNSAISYDPILDCLYVSDPQIHVILKITLSAGTPVSEIAAGSTSGGGSTDGGLGTNRLNSPKGTCVGPDGAVYIADSGNNSVRKLLGGNVSTISDTSFNGSNPSDVTVWPDGSVFVACSSHHCIRRLTPNATTPITYTASVYAGSSGTSGSADGALVDARFNYPQGITADINYNMYVVDTLNYCVRQITGGNVLTIAGTGGSGRVDGTSAVAKFQFTGVDTGQNVYAGIHSDNFGNIYVTDYKNAATRLIATTGATITEAQLANYQSSAAIKLQASSALQQKASSALIEGLKSSSALQQAESAAKPLRESSALQQRDSSAVKQVDSSARQQVDSSARQQRDSSALVQRDSSAVQQTESSAVRQTASSAVQQRDSSARQQRDSSAVQQRDSSAVQQTESSAVRQTASSAVQQRDSSAVQQRYSSAVQQSDSSAQQQSASSAQLESVLLAAINIKNGLITNIKTIEEDIAANTAIVYSQTAASADKGTAKAALTTRIADLTAALAQLSTTSDSIFALSPNYQDRGAQVVVPDPYLQSIGHTKLYDTMRKSYVIIDANGYIVENLERPDKRPLISGQKGGAALILPTDMELVGDLTIPSNSQWVSYYDSVDRKYFYLNKVTGVEQYLHPYPPILSETHPILTDITTNFLPAGWMKLQSSSPNMPYYFNSASTEVSWVHPNPPKYLTTSQKVIDATLAATYEKYIDAATNAPFYMNSITRESQWNFPDLAFLPGPSAAVRDSSARQQAASSALVQRDSSALVQRDSSAVQQVASSAVQQTASSAVQQRASSALVQRDSSALVQRDSSAVQQVASSAVQQTASSAVQQRASSALVQRDSSAVQQSVSSAVQKQASSATFQAALSVPVTVKETIKSDIIPLKENSANTLAALYAPGGNTEANKALMTDAVNALATKQKELIQVGNAIFEIDPNHQDPSLQIDIPDPRLAALNIRKVFDLLRNKQIYLNSNNEIIDAPLILNAQQSGAQKGGKFAKTKRIRKR